MPRSNTGAELFKQLDSVEKYISAAAGDQVISAAVATGVTLVTVAGSTSFASADPVLIIGDGGVELNEITGAPSTAMPLKYKTQFAQSAGGRLLEMTKIIVGDIEQGGVVISPSQQLTSIYSAIASVPIAAIASPVEMSATIPLLGWNNLNLQTFFGITEAESGTGTAADPYTMNVGESNVNGVGYQAFRLTGKLFDGRTVLIDLIDARVQIGGSMTFNRQTPAVIPVTIKFNNLIQRIYT